MPAAAIERRVGERRVGERRVGERRVGVEVFGDGLGPVIVFHEGL